MLRFSVGAMIRPSMDDRDHKPGDPAKPCGNGIPREVEVALPGGFAISPAARAAIKQIPGIVDVHDV